MGFLVFLLPAIVIIGQLCAVLALAFVLAVHGDWRLVLIVILGFAAGLIPLVLRGPPMPTPLGAILALVLLLLLAVLYGAIGRWIAATICLLSATLLIHGVFLPVALRPVAFEDLQKFGVTVALCGPIIAALVAKEIALRFKPLQSKRVDRS
jgi:hypothetical protein